MTSVVPLLDGKRIVICAGSGGVGKTTTSAALAMGMAAQGLRVAVVGSQEFTAIAKLYELDQEGGYDLLVLDTPPSRNALDFLDAPGRLTGFFQGRAIRMFLRPAGFGGKIIGRGTGVVFSLLKRVTGVDLLEDLSVFFRSLSGLIDGFTERA